MTIELRKLIPCLPGVLFIPQLEMRSQDQQLARTLLGLNSEIQRMRRESYGALEVEGDDQP